MRQIKEGALLDWYTSQLQAKTKKPGLFSKKLTPEMMLCWTQVNKYTTTPQVLAIILMPHIKHNVLNLTSV